MTTRLDYINFNEDSQKLQLEFKIIFMKLESLMDDNLLNSREKSLALTALEESWMWVGKSLKVDQIKRGSAGYE